jgi:triosephosphate isomerase
METMNKQLRKAVIAGNWKMNKTPAEAKALLGEIAPLVKGAGCTVAACVPFVDLPAALEAAKGTDIQIGAENCHWAESGAFTGEISAGMLSSLGVGWVIIGHSERRTYFGETDATVNKRIRAALNAGLTVILCVGESLEQREQGVTAEHIRYQIKVALLGLTAGEVSKLVIAYEPIWAIGTGKTATNEQAEEVCAIIRQLLVELYGKDVSGKTRILYGGSVNAGNAKALFAMPNIDGGLVGGASLKLDAFEKIVKHDA